MESDTITTIEPVDDDGHTSIAGEPGGSGERGASLDGRRRLRERNVRSVLDTILDLRDRGEPVSLERVADRSGVTVRSLYRYFDDLDDAVAAARQDRIDEIERVWAGFPPIDPADPLAARIAQLVDQRIQLERLGRPLRTDDHVADPTIRFDAEAVAAFEPELALVDAPRRRAARRATSFLLRPRTIRALIEPDDDLAATHETLSFAVEQIVRADTPAD